MWWAIVIVLHVLPWPTPITVIILIFVILITAIVIAYFIALYKHFNIAVWITGHAFEVIWIDIYSAHWTRLHLVATGLGALTKQKCEKQKQGNQYDQYRNAQPFHRGF